MDTTELVYIASQTLIITLMLSLPTVGIGAVVGLLVGLFQGLTQIQDQTISFALRMAATFIVLLLTAGWMGSELFIFAVNQFDRIITL